MFLVTATSQYLSSGSHFLTVAVSPFSCVQSDAEAHVAEAGFIDVRISDSRNLEDGDYHPIPALKVFVDLDDLYAMVPETQWQPSSNTPLPAQFLR